MMGTAYKKDIFRTIIKNWKRFISIIIITALGVGMMSGLYAACLDMYYSADKFYDEHNLFDIRILSTLGFSQTDLDAISKLDDVEIFEGGYSENVYNDIDGVRKTAEISVISQKGLNTPKLIEGDLPQRSGQIAVTQKYIDDSGKSIGDTILLDLDEHQKGKADKTDTADNANAPDKTASDTDIDFDVDTDIEFEEDSSALLNTAYTITGIVVDPMNIENNQNGTSFRSDIDTDYTLFITADNIDSDIYTVLYIRLRGTADMLCYSEEYESAVGRVTSYIENTIKRQREKIRYHSVFDEALETIKDAENTMQEKFAEADEKFTDAWDDILEAERELRDGEKELKARQKDADIKIRQARSKMLSYGNTLADAIAEANAAKDMLSAAETELNANADELASGRAQFETEKRQALDELNATESELNDADRQLKAQRAAIESGVSQLKAAFGELWPAPQWHALANRSAALSAQGVDQTGIQHAAAAEITALAAAMHTSVAFIKPALIHEISVAQAALTIANNELNALNNQLKDARQTADAAKTNLLNKQALLSAATDALKIETDKLNALEEGSLEYNEQLIVVAAAQYAVDTASADVESAAAAVAYSDGEVASLSSSCDTKALEISGLNTTIQQMNQQLESLDTAPETAVQLAIASGMVSAGQKELDAGKGAFFAAKAAALQAFDEAESDIISGEKSIAEARTLLDEKKVELEEGKQQLAAGIADFEAGKARLNIEAADADRKIAEAWAELNDGRAELDDGKSELLEQEQKYISKKDDAYNQLAEAYIELYDIDMTRWYVQNRSSLDSYSSLKNDLSSIEAVGQVFPAIFLLVAILVSLTTMTRMVEEERGLIGTYKALGFYNAAIYSKYILFALAACIGGGILGDLFGFILMPKLISAILAQLYIMPEYYLRFDALYGVGGVLLFMAGIIGSTILALRKELKQMPAVLMRPKAPRAGSRVFLERIPIIWNRISFLNKVTIRNLFRYKKRLFMTIGGIMGCTALILCGFAIKDSVERLPLRQYGEIYKYDLMAIAKDDGNYELTALLSSDDEILEYINLRIESVKLINADSEEEAAQLMVIPRSADISEYINIVDLNGNALDLSDTGAIITKNASEMLDIGIGETVAVQDIDLVQREAQIYGIAANYIGNNIYMSESMYETLFGKYEANGALALLSESYTDHAAYAERLVNDEVAMSAMNASELRDGFSFDLIGAVVLLLVAVAGGLAFVVLFTLSNTNISERVRELATIKVLGFHDAEVHQYVHKETFIITLMGILLGMPFGRLISGLLTVVLHLPSIHFAVHVEPISYIIAAAITLCFAIIVNWMTKRTLNNINMVDALKSIE
ncbi:MAG: FtsX-like permease family protein [Christensenellales bacterium]|jgi:putative ABC transport system permease protein